eukprot:scaffold8081_cov65-Phaeocystis_antarctica.AAC.8
MSPLSSRTTRGPAGGNWNGQNMIAEQPMGRAHDSCRRRKLADFRPSLLLRLDHPESRHACLLFAAVRSKSGLLY